VKFARLWHLFAQAQLPHRKPVSNEAANLLSDNGVTDERAAAGFSSPNFDRWLKPTATRFRVRHNRINRFRAAIKTKWQ
jgi:hypothetical protein